MKLFAIAAVAAATLVAGSASAQVYAKGTIGANTQGMEWNHVEAKAYSAGVGYDFGDWRVEADVVSLGDVESRDTDAVIYSGNVFYDFKPVYGLNPYVGAGIGFGDLTGSGVRGDNRDLVANFTVGASHDLSENLAVTVDYRHFTSDQLQNLQHDRKVRTFEANTVNVGMRYKF